MWRFCDLHNHTCPNEQCADGWDPDTFVTACIAQGLDVVAVTDHDHVDHLDDVLAAAADTPLDVIPGVELTTDRGHLLVLSPGSIGPAVLRNLVARVGAVPGGQVAIDDVLAVASTGCRPDGSHYSEHLVLIGAHVDADGSILGSPNQLGIEGQLAIARRLHALEVSNDSIISEWLAGGVKQSDQMTLLKGSDSHDPSARRHRGTWLYLPDIDAASVRHALALREAAVSHAESKPGRPDYVIESVTFKGGLHDGVTLSFSERANAVIGPPNSGKSLIIDALKFVFDLSSDIDDVETVSKARMAKCLPHGTTVEVRVRTPEGVVPLSRAVGGRPPSPPFRPIIFSQTELTRRAIAVSPAIGLLDLHCPGIDTQKEALAITAREVETEFALALDNARLAKTLRASVTNPVDGLAATRAELNRIAGTEEVAKQATSADQVANWRTRLGVEVERWAAHSELPGPTIPAPPTVLSSTPELKKFVPHVSVSKVVGDVKVQVRKVLEGASDAIGNILAADEEAFTQTQERVENELAAAGFERGSEVDARLKDLRARIDVRETEQQELSELELAIDAQLDRLKELHSRVYEARQALSVSRRGGCRTVNSSMRTFFARVIDTAITDQLDSLIDHLKTGTYLREGSRQEIRDRLDRFRVLEYAVRWEQGRGGELDGGDQDQDRVIAEAMRRGHSADVARLSCLWPGDGLELAQRSEPEAPFGELTEGLRALAIKEISFAASNLPVITDQPEDAVPTRFVFDSLVPTLREQRVARQFIVVSHDANIVVASDIELICILAANDDGTHHAGGLGDSRVRSAALEHLEGGSAAFNLRAERYAQFGSQ